MKAFLIKNRRLMYLFIPVLLQLAYFIILRTLTPTKSYQWFLTDIDNIIPFKPFMIYGTILWILIFLSVFLYLYFSAGNSYYRFTVCISSIMLISVILYLSYPAQMIYPETTGFFLADILYSDIFSIPFLNMPTAIMTSSIFFLLNHKRKHKHSKYVLLLILSIILLLMWAVFALYSKSAVYLGILSGIGTSMIVSFAICSIPFKHTF
ncbi:MAG TPA: hypothetical protein PLS36_06295 [Clostridia bacterium]|nr:hypothetical protein [Clostridia bacterium]